MTCRSDAAATASGCCALDTEPTVNSTQMAAVPPATTGRYRSCIVDLERLCTICIFDYTPIECPLMSFLRACLVWSFLAIAASAAAQVAAGSVTGVITDQARATVPGAVVTVTNVATNFQRVVASTAGGVYTAAGLAPGTYRIDVELQGFKPLR